MISIAKDLAVKYGEIYNKCQAAYERYDRSGLDDGVRKQGTALLKKYGITGPTGGAPDIRDWNDIKDVIETKWAGARMIAKKNESDFITPDQEQMLKLISESGVDEKGKQIYDLYGKIRQAEREDAHHQQAAEQEGQSKNEPAPYDGLNAHDFSKWGADVSPDGTVTNPRKMAFDLALEGENSGEGLYHFFDEKKEIDDVKKKMDVYVKDHPEDDKAQLWSELINAKAAGLKNVLVDNYRAASALESGIYRVKQLGWSVNKQGLATLDMGTATANIDFLKDTGDSNTYEGTIEIGGRSLPLKGDIHQITTAIHYLKDVTK